MFPFIENSLTFVVKETYSLTKYVFQIFLLSFCFGMVLLFYKLLNCGHFKNRFSYGGMVSHFYAMPVGYKLMMLILNRLLKSMHWSPCTEFSDQGEFWRAPYETDDLEQILVRLFNELKPLYEQLHAYVRRKLMKFYPKEEFPDAGHIPAHLLGKLSRKSLIDNVEIYSNILEEYCTD